MSKTKVPWWGYVRRVVRDYPVLAAQLKQRQADATSISPARDGSGGGRGAGIIRPAERAALQLLPPARQRELDAVEAAIDCTRRLLDGDTRLRLVRLVFWNRSHTLQGAALETHMSCRSAQRRISQFLWLVGEKMGLG